MKRFVAILAVGLLAGCGVGADESWDMNTGTLVSTKSAQALEETPPTTPIVPQAPATTTPSPVRDPGQVSLPQDPIPVFEAKPVPLPTNAMPVGPGLEVPLPVPANR